MAWSSNQRLVETDPADTGKIHLFDREDLMQMLEVSAYKLGQLIRRAKVKPFEGRGKAAKFTANDFNEIVNQINSQPGYQEPRAADLRRLPRLLRVQGG